MTFDYDIVAIFRNALLATANEGFELIFCKGYGLFDLFRSVTIFDGSFLGNFI